MSILVVRVTDSIHGGLLLLKDLRCKTRLMSLNVRSRRCLSWKKSPRTSPRITMMSRLSATHTSWSKSKSERRKIGARWNPRGDAYKEPKKGAETPKRRATSEHSQLRNQILKGCKFMLKGWWNGRENASQKGLQLKPIMAEIQP